jgi:hypothetical protein
VVLPDDFVEGVGPIAASKDGVSHGERIVSGDERMEKPFGQMLLPIDRFRNSLGKCRAKCQFDGCAAEG